MRRYTTYLTVAIVATLLLAGCFKDERQGTLFKIAVYSKNVDSDPVTKTTTEIESYAYHVGKGTKWEVKSWEDALELRVTNKEDSSKVLTEPDVVGTFDAEAEYQVSIGLWSQYVFMLVIDRTNKLYATRFYETPMNLPETLTQLHLYASRKSGAATGWDVINPFPDEPREPLVPVETEEEETEDASETTDNNTQAE